MKKTTKDIVLITAIVALFASFGIVCFKSDFLGFPMFGWGLILGSLSVIVIDQIVCPFGKSLDYYKFGPEDSEEDSEEDS